jgi:hypothetical protein
MKRPGSRWIPAPSHAVWVDRHFEFPVVTRLDFFLDVEHGAVNKVRLGLDLQTALTLHAYHRRRVGWAAWTMPTPVTPPA